MNYKLFFFACALNEFFYVPNLLASPIIGGQEDTDNTYKYHVSVRHSYDHERPNSGEHLCGGTIVHFRYVLSVAHYFMGIVDRHMTVLRYPRDHGIAVLSGTSATHGPGTITLVVTIFIPHDYHSGLSNMHADISVLKLEHNLNHAGIQILPIDLEHHSGDRYVHGDAFILGNGCDTLEHGVENCRAANMRQFLKVYILPRDRCPQFNFAICVINSDPLIFRTACKYDAGSPLVFEDIVIGVVSGGPGDCSMRISTKCTRTAKFVDFILNAMNEDPERHAHMYSLTHEMHYNLSRLYISTDIV